MAVEIVDADKAPSAIDEPHTDVVDISSPGDFPNVTTSGSKQLVGLATAFSAMELDQPEDTSSQTATPSPADRVGSPHTFSDE